MVYVLLIACFFVVNLNAFFGPSEETKVAWEKIIVSENLFSAKARLQLCPQEADYVVKTLEPKITESHTDNQGRVSSTSDKFKMIVGNIVAVGAVVIIGYAWKINVNDGNRLDVLTLPVIGAVGAGGLSLSYKGFVGNGENTEKSLRAIRDAARETLQKNDSQKRW